MKLSVDGFVFGKYETINDISDEAGGRPCRNRAAFLKAILATTALMNEQASKQNPENVSLSSASSRPSSAVQRQSSSMGVKRLKSATSIVARFSSMDKQGGLDRQM